MSKPFKKPEYKAEDWIKFDETMELLNVKKSTLFSIISRGKIPDKFISKGVNGAKFFYKPGLMGFDN